MLCKSLPIYCSHSSFSLVISSPFNIALSLPVSKKFFGILMFNVFPKRLGRVNRFTYAGFFFKVPNKSCFINIIKSLFMYSAKIFNPHGKFCLFCHTISLSLKTFLFFTVQHTGNYIRNLTKKSKLYYL